MKTSQNSPRTLKHGRYELARLLRDGKITRLRRAAYASKISDDPTRRHRQLLDLIVPGLDEQTIISHASAGILHGFPCPNSMLTKVAATRSQRSGGRVTKDLHIYTNLLLPEDCTFVEGIRCTSPLRTLIDMARLAPTGWGTAICDDALARGLVSGFEIADWVEQKTRRRGDAAVRRALTFADARSESVAESLSRVALVDQGLPLPDLQQQISTYAGQFRVDFLWAAERVIGECDGMSKYQTDAGPSPMSILAAEKRREDALRGAGYIVVRWGWDDMMRPHVLAAKVRRAMDQSRRGGLTQWSRAS